MWRGKPFVGRVRLSKLLEQGHRREGGCLGRSWKSGGGKPFPSLGKLVTLSSSPSSGWRVWGMGRVWANEEGF